MFLAICKLLKVLVARDGIEPPTPAFSGPLWAVLGSSMFAYCSHWVSPTEIATVLHLLTLSALVEIEDYFAT